MNKIKVLLVDDHVVVRAGFKLLLSAAVPNIEVVAEAGRGELAIQQYQSHRPDIVVMDLSMPGIGGLETIKRIIQRDSAANILVFSVHDEQVYVQRALNAGAKGYITKNSAPNILPAAIESILQGQTYIEQGLIKVNTEQSSVDDYQQIISAFSVREFDIFTLLAKGLTSHKIADELCLGYKTVANYVTQIKKKLHVSSITELVHIAVLQGVVKH
ncbi:MAG: response regulator [Methyloprofundus sp.]|nr:response regulator [Methyloprofundus sp.]